MTLIGSGMLTLHMFTIIKSSLCGIYIQLLSDKFTYLKLNETPSSIPMIL